MECKSRELLIHPENNGGATASVARALAQNSLDMDIEGIENKHECLYPKSQV